MRANDDVLRGAARVAPVTRRAGAEYLPHNIVIGSVGAHARQSAARERHRCARLRRACGRSFRLRCSGANGKSLVLLARLCLHERPHPLLRRAHYRDPSDIVRQISALARLAPVTPPACPLRSWKSQARKRKISRFAGEHDAGGLRRRGEARRPSPVNRTSQAACNVAGGSTEKTASRVACLKRQRAPRT